jgi:hypothetical protein
LERQKNARKTYTESDTSPCHLFRLCSIAAL